MKFRTLVEAGAAHASQSLKEAVYLQTGLDITSPMAIRGVVNERCNYRCKSCKCWRQDKYLDEMTAEEWKHALLNLKEFIGRYVIQFSGGEPFIKKGFLEVLEYCRDQGIGWGVITNGSAFVSRQVVERVVRALPMNVDISVDGAEADTHDRSRGVSGSFSNVSRGLLQLRQERKRAGGGFPIRIKPTVHLLNYQQLPAMVDWAVQEGASTVDFSPVRPWTTEVEKELWIREEKDFELLNRVTEKLVSMQKEGAPIETSAEKLRSFADHFRGKSVHHGVSPCRVGMRDFHIGPNGDVQMCWFYESVGNVRQNSAREIWTSAQARKLRAGMVTCTKFGKVECANSCMSHRTLTQQVKRGLLLLRRSAS